MAHNVLVNGTSYNVTGGKTLVDGTAYDIASGKTLVNGTAYDILFVKMISFEVQPQRYVASIQQYQYYEKEKFYATEGMTWSEFIIENTAKFGYDSISRISYTNETHGTGYLAKGGYFVLLSDVIIDGFTYTCEVPK